MPRSEPDSDVSPRMPVDFGDVRHRRKLGFPMDNFGQDCRMGRLSAQNHGVAIALSQRRDDITHFSLFFRSFAIKSKCPYEPRLAGLEELLPHEHFCSSQCHHACASMSGLETAASRRLPWRVRASMAADK